MSYNERDYFKDSKSTAAFAGVMIENFWKLCGEYFAQSPFRNVIEVDAEAGQKIVKIQAVDGIPDIIVKSAMSATETIKNAFDQAMYAACYAVGAPPKKDVFFPWCANPRDLEHKLGAIPGVPSSKNKDRIPEQLRAVLRTLEPYPKGHGYTGGDTIVRELAELANRKHTFNLSHTLRMDEVLFPSFSGRLTGPFSLPMARWDTVKNEIVLMRLPVSAPDPKADAALKFQVCFDERGSINGHPVGPALQHFHMKAQRAIGALEAECRSSGRTSA
jgi:hypothetical protein